jgi:hypothetical protein
MVRAIYEEITILCSGTNLKGPYFWSWNAQVHAIPNYDR